MCSKMHKLERVRSFLEEELLEKCSQNKQKHLFEYNFEIRKIFQHSTVRKIWYSRSTYHSDFAAAKSAGKLFTI